MTDSLKDLSQRQHEFALQRGWIPLNSPKNLACALMVEAAELLEHFQWMKEADSFTLPPDKHHAVSTEMADVLIYLVQLGNVLGIDVVQAAHEKIAVNARKYPLPGNTP
ncbi:MAG: nucleotide pyrophosphohydrolase [Lautropia sp.]|nr:nucleotide pyrophosphohydrolase [Lautropia sp.]